MRCSPTWRTSLLSQSTLKHDADIPPQLAEKFIKGEITLGDFVGLKRDTLYRIAQVGYHLLASGKHDEAKQIYLGLVAADPYDSVFHCHLATVCHRLGDLGRALDEYTEALRFNKANADALAGRGELHLMHGRLPESITDLRAAIKLDPQGKRRSTIRARAILLSLKDAADKQRADKQRAVKHGANQDASSNVVNRSGGEHR